MDQETEFTIDDMRKDLQTTGIWLLVIGVISILLRNILSPIWGILLIIVGLLTLAVPARGLYILFGIMLLLIGVWNMVGGGGWLVLGVFQLYWGVMEFVKYGKYAEADGYY